MSNPQSQKPEKTFRIGGVTAAVWCHHRQIEGLTVTSYNVTAGNRYLDKDTNTWQDSSTFFAEDLPRLILVLQKAYEYIAFGGAQNGDPDA